jgi:hypothetical protein
MQAVTGISNLPAQILTLTAADGSAITLTLEYRPQQQGWSLDVSWNGTSPATAMNGLRVTNFPNLLRQWRNLITFGLTCVTADGLEPLSIDAFSSGYAQLFLLAAADVARIEDEVFYRA